MTEIILYDAANVPSPRRVRIVLLEKGLPFRIKWLNLGLMDQKQESYLKLNPTGLVPTLVHGEDALYESNVINEYLDALYPEPPLVPREPLAQARMRMWFAFESDWAKPFRDAAYETLAKKRLQDSGMTPEQLRAELMKRTRNEAYVKFATRVLTTPRNDDLLEFCTALLFEKIGQMEATLADGRPWLCGDRFTLADIALIPRMETFPAIGITDIYERFPRIAAWAARVKARPSWEKSAIRPEPGESERVVTVERRT